MKTEKKFCRVILEPELQEIAALWPAAEALAGRPLDPLDPKILERREAMNG